MKTRIYFITLALLPIVSCSKPTTQEPTQEQNIVNSFNSRSYSFKLGYDDGQYTLSPIKTIPAKEIQLTVDGKTFQLIDLGRITPEGYSEGESDGMGLYKISFSENAGHVISKPIDPFAEIFEKDLNVIFEDNSMHFDSYNLTVCSISSTDITCFEQISPDVSLWAYYSLRLQ